MGFLTPKFGRKRFTVASLIGLAWLATAWLLWAYPNSVPRRSGVAKNHFGLLDAWIRLNSYHRSNPGMLLGYETGKGFGITIAISVIVTMTAVGMYWWLIRRW